MTTSEKTEVITHIIACAVFTAAMEHLQLKKKYPNMRLTYLPARLHLKPAELKKRLQLEVRRAQAKGERIICLYGECFPDIDGFCKRHSIIKVPGSYCYEMLLGSKRFKQLIEETTGTYFLEEGLIINFEDFCMGPLELKDEEMRRQCFEHYKKLLYIRQPSDKDLVPRASELAQLLGLSLEIQDADYSHIEKTLTESIKGDTW
jgi:Protein of unknown function (DUF1638).